MVLEPFGDAVLVEPMLTVNTNAIVVLSVWSLQSGHNITDGIVFEADTAAFGRSAATFDSSSLKEKGSKRPTPRGATVVATVAKEPRMVGLVLIIGGTPNTDFRIIVIVVVMILAIFVVR